MILDELNEFCDALAISTTGTGTFLLGDQIPLSVARDIGSGEPVYAVISVDTAIGSTGNATVLFKVVSDNSAAISTTGGATEHIVTSAIPKATLAAGYQMVFALPLEGAAYETYLGVLATVGTAKLNAGKVNAFLTCDPKRWKTYADAVSYPAAT
jgi:hypothetical protein